jgi:hypothetical protein
MAMSRPIQLVTPDRLQIREGGGCMSVFGLPFFAAGIFLILAITGVIPMSNASELPAFAVPLIVLMGIVFTCVGGTLVFGRMWTTIDRSQRAVIKQWGLLVPMRERILPLHGHTAVRLGFVEGDSDSADQFPVALKAQAGADLQLRSFTAYADARACARAVAEHLRLELEDASTDHEVRLQPGEIDVSLQERLRRDGATHEDGVPPSGARSRVTRDSGQVTIVIPTRRRHVLVLAAGLIPIALALYIGPPLATFFRQSRTPDPVAWAFLGFLALFFGVLPLMTIVNGFVRSRRGATIVEASRKGVRIRERGAWTTRTVESFDAPDILDVDYSSRESTHASAQRAAEQQVLKSYPSSSPASASPRVERIVATLSRFAKGRGVTIKTRIGLTTFGKGLDDAEIRYLHSVVRRALGS